jgi:serine/threonine protein kinase
MPYRELTPNETIHCKSGRKLVVDRVMGMGGQGVAYEVHDQRSRTKGVLKILLPPPQTEQDMLFARVKWLVDRNLPDICPVLVGPVDWISDNGLIGHYCSYANGETLENVLKSGGLTLLDSLQLSLVVAHGISKLHEAGVSHGDISWKNVIVEQLDSVFKAHIIDFDNYYAPGIPEPYCAGQVQFMAPEVRKAFSRHELHAPDVETDRFSLGIIMHQAILQFNFCAGLEGNVDAFHEAMVSGRWVYDPARKGKPLDNPGGCPPEALDTDLSRLLRRFPTLDRDQRPTAEEWVQVLSRALFRVQTCPYCNRAFLLDMAKTCCPHQDCGKTFPTLTLVTASGRSVIIDRGSIIVGRDVLAGSNRVHSKHAVLRRCGPITLLESIGANGVYRRANTSWVKLPQGRPIQIRTGDKLLFGDLPAHVMNS